MLSEPITVDEMRRRFMPFEKPPGKTIPFRRIFERYTVDPNAEYLYRIASPQVEHDVRLAGGHLPRGVGRPPTVGLATLSYAVDRLRAAVPSWLPVRYRDPALARDPEDYPREVEGRLMDSHLSTEDFPVRPWHYWYDWNFEVSPVEGYRYLVARGHPPTLHCEWDMGTIGAHGPGDPQFNQGGPMFMASPDWCWPMRGWYVWISGRWILDAGHAVDQAAVNRDTINSVLRRARPSTADGQRESAETRAVGALQQLEHDADLDMTTAYAQQADAAVVGGQLQSMFPAAYAENLRRLATTYTELHPCKALATWRSEGVQFEQGRPYVPAVQFMFFACRLGGYLPFSQEQWGQRAYFFIVELPELPERPAEQHIGGASTTGGAGTVAPASWPPNLLHQIDQTRFHQAVNPGVVAPIVRRIHTMQDGRSVPTSQVLVEVPREAFGTNDSYGVAVSLGWDDSNGNAAASLYDVEVIIRGLEIDGDTIGDVNQAHFRFGVNGRWHVEVVPIAHTLREDAALILPSRRIHLATTRFQLKLRLDDPLDISFGGFLVLRSDGGVRLAGAVLPGSALTVHELMTQRRSVTGLDRWEQIMNAPDTPDGGLPRHSGDGWTVDQIANALALLAASTQERVNVELVQANLQTKVREHLRRYGLRTGQLQTRADVSHTYAATIPSRDRSHRGYKLTYTLSVRHS